MFIILLNYIRPVEEVDAVIPAHIDYLERYYQLDKFVLSGRKRPRTGGVILCQAKDKEEVWTMIAEDPFFIKKVADYDVLEFLPTKTAVGLERYLV
ncbi:YciI family protein [Acetobacterium sp.]|uniref:YciI family protein n=1 Tax=Acetobacterium sp. TaxID=1872094 RepID=UPI003593A346